MCRKQRGTYAQCYVCSRRGRRKTASKQLTLPPSLKSYSNRLNKRIKRL